MKRGREEKDEHHASKKMKRVREDFLEACGFGNLTKVEELIESVKENASGRDDMFGSTALHLAAEKGWVDVAKVLLRKGADVNAITGPGETALHRTAEKGYVDVAKVLLQNEADVNALDEEDRTALHLAAGNGHLEVLTLLLQNNNADVEAVDDWNDLTPLGFAARDGQFTCALQLICFGAEIRNNAIEEDSTGLLQPIKDRLESLRAGNGIESTLMSDEERRFMWHVAWFLDQKCPEATFKAFYAIYSFITFHGIFMVPGYRPPSSVLRPVTGH